MASIALVLSILVPSVGNTWYGLTALSPLAAIYYFSRGERVEQVRLGGAQRCVCCVLSARARARCRAFFLCVRALRVRQRAQFAHALMTRRARRGALSLSNTQRTRHKRRCASR